MQGSYVGDLWGAPWRPTLSMTCRSNRACSHSLAVMPPIHPSHARGAMARLLQHAYAERPRRRSTWSANGCSCARTVRRSPGRMRSNLTRRGHSWRPGGDSWFSACSQRCRPVRAGRAIRRLRVPTGGACPLCVRAHATVQLSTGVRPLYHCSYRRASASRPDHSRGPSSPDGES
jgi:hypothetical protein